MIIIKIDTVDKSSIIRFGSITKKDVINQIVDTLEFDIDYYPGQTFRPTVNSEVEMLDGATTVFGGRINNVIASNNGKGKIRYKVKCKDYSYDFNRPLLNEEYNNQTVNAIIADIISTINAEIDIVFTGNNVSADLTIIKVSFSRVTGTEALERLADITGYNWYIDEDKDIHFFEKNTEPAPFNLVDGDGNYITDTLKIDTDFSQIRNKVNIKGGEIEGVSRTEYFAGDGERLQFKLSNKFAHIPTVEVDGSPVTVGLEFIDPEADFDAFWDFTQQYIRFKVGTVPGVPGGPGANNIEVTGIPLFNLVVQVSNPASISEFGLFEFAKTEKTLLSREEAVEYAKAQLAAYAIGVNEGGFNTYTSGLRSGQIINIQSTLFGVDEDFVIQKVAFKQVSKEQFIWQITIATLRTIGFIDLLLGLLRQEGALVGDEGDIVIEKTEFPQETISVFDAVEVNTDDIPIEEIASVYDSLNVQALNFDTEFVLGPYNHDPTNPTDTKRVFILNGSLLG